MYNKAIIVGNLGRDPELRRTQNDKAVCNFSVATKEYNGETEWHNIVTFGATAENCSKYLVKGSKVLVDGRIQTRSWEDDATGQKRYKTEIVAFTVQFLSGKGNQGQEDSGGYDDGGDGIPF